MGASADPDTSKREALQRKLRDKIRAKALDRQNVHPLIRVLAWHMDNCGGQLVCQPVCLSVHQSVHQSVCLSVHQSVCLSVHQSVHQSVYLYVHQSVCLSAHQSAHQSVCLSVHHVFSPPVYLSVNSHSHTLLITCTCCYDESKGTKDQDFSHSFSGFKTRSPPASSVSLGVLKISKTWCLGAAGP